MAVSRVRSRLHSIGARACESQLWCDDSVVVARVGAAGACVRNPPCLSGGEIGGNRGVTGAPSCWKCGQQQQQEEEREAAFRKPSWSPPPRVASARRGRSQASLKRGRCTAALLGGLRHRIGICSPGGVSQRRRSTARTVRWDSNRGARQRRLTVASIITYRHKRVSSLLWSASHFFQSRRTSSHPTPMGHTSYPYSSILGLDVHFKS